MKKCSLLVLVAFLCVSAFGGVVVEIGNTEKEVLQKNPDVLGSGIMQGKKVLMYSDAKVFLEDGIVVSFEGNAESEQSLKWESEQKEANEQKREKFEQKQRDLGLVLYCGSWVTPKEKEKDKLNKEKIWSEKVANRRAELLELKSQLLKAKRLVLATETRLKARISIFSDSKMKEMMSAKGEINTEASLVKIDLLLIEINCELEKLQ